VREALEEEHLAALEHAELRVLPHGGLDALHGRERRLPQPERERAARRELPQPHPHPHATGLLPLEQPGGHEVGDEAVSGRRGQTRAARDLARGELGVLGVEGREHAHDALDDRLARSGVRHEIRS